MTASLAIAVVQLYSVDMRDAALDDMRQQLAEARADRDRAEARCAELERRLEVIREVVK